MSLSCPFKKFWNDKGLLQTIADKRKYIHLGSNKVIKIFFYLLYFTTNLSTVEKIIPILCFKNIPYYLLKLGKIKFKEPQKELEMYFH